MSNRWGGRFGDGLQGSSGLLDKMSRADAQLIFLVCHSDVLITRKPAKRLLLFDSGQASCRLFLVIQITLTEDRQSVRLR